MCIAGDDGAERLSWTLFLCCSASRSRRWSTITGDNVSITPLCPFAGKATINTSSFLRRRSYGERAIRTLKVVSIAPVDCISATVSTANELTVDAVGVVLKMSWTVVVGAIPLGFGALIPDGDQIVDS